MVPGRRRHPPLYRQLPTREGGTPIRRPDPLRGGSPEQAAHVSTAPEPGHRHLPKARHALPRPLPLRRVLFFLHFSSFRVGRASETKATRALGAWPGKPPLRVLSRRLVAAVGARGPCVHAKHLGCQTISRNRAGGGRGKGGEGKLLHTGTCLSP